MIKVVWLLPLLSLLVACTPWRTEYLQESLNVATEDQVTQRLGPPLSERRLKSGGTVWVYRYTGSSVSGSDGNVSGSSWCREYILTFDPGEVLRDWIRQKC